MAEMAGNELWRYFDKDADPAGTKSATNNDAIYTGGTQIHVVVDDENTIQSQIWHTKTKKTNVRWNGDLKQFLVNLQQIGQQSDRDELRILTDHHRNGQIFRGHPAYRSEGEWKDWAMFDWGAGYGTLPGQIWCFVVVDWLPEGHETIEFGGINLKNGTYAVIESSQWSDDEEDIGWSDLFVPFQKDVAELDAEGEVVKRRFYLADVDAITSPICAVPDQGAVPRCKYFHVQPRSVWVDEFVSWLMDPHGAITETDSEAGSEEGDDDDDDDEEEEDED
jgi:hypothetical protein